MTFGSCNSTFEGKPRIKKKLTLESLIAAGDVLWANNTNVRILGEKCF